MFRSRDGYDWEPFPPGPYNRQKMMFNFGSPAETFGGIINSPEWEGLVGRPGGDPEEIVNGCLSIGRALGFGHWTIESFEAVVAGDFDHLPEQAFYMVGDIEEAEAKARDLEG